MSHSTSRRFRPLKTALLAVALGVLGWGAIELPALKRHVFIASHAETRTVALLSQLAQRPAKTILVGDSIVEYVALDRLCGVPVLTAGVSGARVEEIIGLARRITDAAKPDRVVVAIGVNDTVRGAETSIEDFTASYRRLLDLWRGADVRLAVATLAPVAESGPLGRSHFDPDRMRRLNDAIRRIAEEKSLPVVPLDTLPTTAAGDLRADLSADGVHLTPEGYRLWLAKIEDGVCAK